MPSYSQFGEDVHIAAAVGPGIGRFLDIGAAPTFSNTRALAEAGWLGVAVEGDAQQFAALHSLYRNNAGVACVLALVGLGAGIVPFYACGDLVGTTEERNRKIWEKTVSFSKHYASQVSLADLLRTFPGPYDVVSIDTEGTSVDLWCALDLRALGVRAAVVEFDNRNHEAEAHGKAHGLRIVHQNGTNLVFGR